MTAAEPFDAEAAYDARISPLMSQIIAICKEERIPMMASFLYARDDTDHFCTTNIPVTGRESKELELAAQAVTQGFLAFATHVRTISPETPL